MKTMFQRPKPGDLVEAKRMFWLCEESIYLAVVGNDICEDLDPTEQLPNWNWVKKGIILMFLGIVEFCEDSVLARNPKYVYKFLSGDRVIYSEPTAMIPPAWVSQYLKLAK